VETGWRPFFRVCVGCIWIAFGNYEFCLLKACCLRRFVRIGMQADEYVFIRPGSALNGAVRFPGRRSDVCLVADSRDEASKSPATYLESLATGVEDCFGRLWQCEMKEFLACCQCKGQRETRSLKSNLFAGRLGKLSRCAVGQVIGVFGP
jgi:hypothetical protein